VQRVADSATVERLLQGAAAAICEYGHLQGSFGDTKRGFCVTGAIRYAAKPYASAVTYADGAVTGVDIWRAIALTYEAATGVPVRRGDEPQADLKLWDRNDRPETTGLTVVRWLIKARRKLAAQRAKVLP
jgi:hypothetical protein